MISVRSFSVHVVRGRHICFDHVLQYRRVIFHYALSFGSIVPKMETTKHAKAYQGRKL